MMRHTCVWVLVLGLAGAARAAGPQDFFDELSFDFGAVPRGPELSHPFRVVNKTDQTVQIGQVRVSCGMCSAARALQTTLAPGQETVILAQMHTSRFANLKQITIYVTFTQPKFEEVRLSIQANSRDDVSFNPDSLDFGKVKRGAAPTQTMTISFYGTSARVVEAKSESNYVQVETKEAKGAGSDNSYQLEAKIRPDTPVGKWYTDIWVITDSPAMPKLRVPLTVEVEAALSISPNAVSLGEVKAGAETDRKVILRSAKAFRITKIIGTDAELQVHEAKADTKTVHVLTVTLRPNIAGELNRTIRVQTDIKNGGEVEFQTMATVVP